MHIKIKKKKNTFDNSGKLTIHRYLIMKNKKLYFELRMKLMKNLRTFTFFMLAGAIAFTTSSCSDDDDSTKSDYGTVTGMVTDENNTPLLLLFLMSKVLQLLVPMESTLSPMYLWINVPLHSPKKII